MRVAFAKIFLAMALLAKLAAGQASAPSKVPRASTPPTPAAAQSAAGAASSHPSPTPTPPRASPASLAPGTIVTGPKYSPTQLDFGVVDYSGSSKRTFSLTSALAGEITLEFPVGAFVLANVMTIPPINLGAKPSQQHAMVPPGKPVPISSKGQVEVYKWNLAAGEEIQLEILFAPMFSKNKTPGERTANMNFGGPGTIGPWAITIPMRGMLSLADFPSDSPQKGVGLTSGAPGKAGGPAASAQPVTPAASQSNNTAATVVVAPHPTPTPNPLGSSSQAPVPAALIPAHSPDQLSFGAVWQGDMTKQTFHFQTFDQGYIHVDLPPPFRISEIRSLAKGSSKNMGKPPSQLAVGPQVKTRVTFTPNQFGPYTALIDASTDVDMDVVFQPQLQSAPGPRSAIMKVTGPGSIHDWGMSIPLQGAVQTGLEASPGQLWAINNDEGAYLDITIHGTNNPVSGTLKAGKVLPAGISIGPQSVNVPAAGTIHTKLWLAFNGIPADGKAHPLQVVFEVSNHSTSTQIQFVGVPDSALEINSADRGDCGVSRASLSLQITPPHQQKTQRTKGRRGWVFLGWNYDLLNNRYVEMSAESGGVTLFSGERFTLPSNTSDQVRKFSLYMEDFDVSAEEWAKVLQGPARFGCRQWDVTPGGAIAPKGPLKWTAAVRGLKF
jgi:hypothetical protein